MPSRSRSKSTEPKRKASARSKSKEPAKAAAPKASPKKKVTESEVVSHGGITHEEYEFGGPIGASALMIWSHYILLYFW